MFHGQILIDNNVLIGGGLIIMTMRQVIFHIHINGLPKKIFVQDFKSEVDMRSERALTTLSARVAPPQKGRNK
jgi:hypothetical protein